MGYCIDLVESDFHIKKENFDEAFKASRKLFEGGKRFAWVENSEGMRARNICEMLEAWGYEPEAEVADDGLGDILDLYFVREKIGDEETLFQAIAPYVEAESYLEYRGEDGAIWRYYFDGTKMVEQSPNITWE